MDRDPKPKSQGSRPTESQTKGDSHRQTSEVVAQDPQQDRSEPAQAETVTTSSRGRHGSRPRRHCSECGTRTRSWSRCHSCTEIFCQKCVVPVEHDCQVYWEAAEAAIQGYAEGQAWYSAEYNNLLLLSQYLRGP